MKIIKKLIAKMYGIQYVKVTSTRQVLILCGSNFRFAKLHDEFLIIPGGMINVTRSNLADLRHAIKECTDSYSFNDCEVFVRA